MLSEFNLKQNHFYLNAILHIFGVDDSSTSREPIARCHQASSDWSQSAGATSPARCRVFTPSGAEHETFRSTTGSLIGTSNESGTAVDFPDAKAARYRMRPDLARNGGVALCGRLFLVAVPSKKTCRFRYGSSRWGFAASAMGTKILPMATLKVCSGDVALDNLVVANVRNVPSVDTSSSEVDRFDHGQPGCAKSGHSLHLPACFLKERLVNMASLI